eukprot:5801300-Karenia_brevis.AAC.1
MTVVSKRRKTFEKDKKESGVRLRSIYENKHECRCGEEKCGEEKWVASVSTPLLAVKRIVEKGNP